jgi:hypothetical protein
VPQYEEEGGVRNNQRQRIHAPAGGSIPTNEEQNNNYNDNQMMHSVDLGQEDEVADSHQYEV